MLKNEKFFNVHYSFVRACVCAHMRMLASYSTHIGRLTIHSVKMSAVGVMIAAMMRMATMAWRRYFFIHCALMIPNLASNQLITGSSKIIPKTNDIMSRVSI